MMDIEIQDKIYDEENGHAERAEELCIRELVCEIVKGRLSGEEDGWLDAYEVFEDLESRYHNMT